MSANILFPRDFNSDNVVFSKMIKQKDSASGNVRMRYNYGTEPERLVIQTARMRVPFGITNNEKYNDKNAPLKWDVRISFDGEDKNKKIQRFRECLDSLDKEIQKEALKNAKEWLNDDDPDEKSIRKSYKSCLKKFKPKADKPDSVYADTFKINIPWDYELNKPASYVEFYDEDGKETDYTSVTNGCEVVALFSINGVWCSPGINSFGTTAKLVQLQVFKPKKIKGFTIKYDKDSDEEDEEETEEVEIEVEEEDELE